MTPFNRLAWLALACCSIAVRAYAEAPRGLAYRAPTGCPTEADFLTQVAARGGRFRAEDERTFDVSVELRGGNFSGSLRVGESEPREVSGASCAEVADALAVVTALALQPSAAVPAEPAASPAPVVSPPAPPAPPEPPRREGIRTTGAVSNAEVQVEAGRLRFTRPIAVAAHGGAMFGLFSRVMPRYDLTLDSTSLVEAPGTEPARVGPVVRLRASVIGPIEFKNTPSAYGIQGGIGLCLSPLYDTRGLVLLACTEVIAGGFSLTTTDHVTGARHQQSTVYAGTGLHGELRYNFSSHFLGTLGAGVNAGSTVFGSSPVLGYVELGLGLHFD
jgi:hypothetical protein